MAKCNKSKVICKEVLMNLRTGCGRCGFQHGPKVIVLGLNTLDFVQTIFYGLRSKIVKTYS